MLDTLTDSLILKILSFCQPTDVVNVGQLSRGLRDVCHDNLLWRGLFHRFFQLPNLYKEPLVCPSWRTEFSRLVDEIPIVESEVLLECSDQVLHVAFSHDGKLFATTGKDAFVHVWKATYPAQLEYSYDMNKFSWKYTQFSQFNESDTLLLVSGVQFGVHTTSGEIAVFGLNNGFELRCRTSNKPYDVFGSWYSDEYFFSGDLHWLDSLTSRSDIWLNKASQEVDSEHKAIMNHCFKFYNPKASSIRSLMVANCSESPSKVRADAADGKEPLLGTTHPSVNASAQFEKSAGNPPSQIAASRQEAAIPNIHYTEEFHRLRKEQRKRRCKSQNEESEEPCSSKSWRKYDIPASSDDSENSTIDASDIDETDAQARFAYTSSTAGETADDDKQVIDSREKLLIFTCGTLTYTPHQIGFKRIPPFPFKGRLEGMTLAEAIVEKKRRESVDSNRRPVNYSNYEAVAHLFDKPDSVLNLSGHIIGMALSPDHQYLYVNCRPWPVDAIISDPLRPPPIAQEIDIHVIDLATLKEVGMMRRAHRAYTPNDECFFIFLDACEEYLGSGSEDHAGYTWDRHYGIPLCRLPHTDVVNSVAFNPNNPEMLVSVSDDNTIKVWRSKRLCRELGINSSELRQGAKIYLNQQQRQVPMRPQAPANPPV